MVAVEKPAAESDAVCLVVELLRVNIIERLQLGLFQYLCVEGSHTIHRVAVVDVDMGHVYPVHLVDDVHSLVMEVSSHPCVQLTDDGHKLGNHLLQVSDGPLLQSLCQDGVVCVGACLSHHINGCVHIEALLGCQNTDQLRDHHGRMGVVDLDAHMLVEVIQVHASLLRLFQNELGRVADHEVLLIDTQKLSRLVAVIRVEEEGQVPADITLVKLNAVVDHALVHGIDVKEMELVAAALVSRHVNIVHGGSKCKVLKWHFKMAVCLCKP